MSEYGNIEATVRNSRGKGAARQLRMRGLIPGVLYGQGRDNIALELNPMALQRATDPAKRVNTLFSLTIHEEGKPDVVESAIVVDLQRNLVRDNVTHIDFMRVDLEQEVQRKIPVRFFGKSVGVTAGGKLRTFVREVKVAAKPADVPVELAVDITPIEAGQTVRVRDITIPNVRIMERADSPIVVVEAVKAKTEEQLQAEKDAAAAAEKGGKKK
jgi:large subunit ribosomal protein L25